VGTPICVPSQGRVDLGKITSLELNHKPVDRARKGESVAMKIEATNTTEATRLYGRHFDHKVRATSPRLSAALQCLSAVLTLACYLCRHNFFNILIYLKEVCKDL
jgi:hypothetical protein